MKKLDNREKYYPNKNLKIVKINKDLYPSIEDIELRLIDFFQEKFKKL